MENVYKEHGYLNRQDYLKELADYNGLDFNVVYDLAIMLGENEDFDRLLIVIEDYASDGGF